MRMGSVVKTVDGFVGVVVRSDEVDGRHRVVVAIPLFSDVRLNTYDKAELAVGSARRFFREAAIREKGVF